MRNRVPPTERIDVAISKYVRRGYDEVENETTTPGPIYIQDIYRSPNGEPLRASQLAQIWLQRLSIEYTPDAPLGTGAEVDA